MLKIPATRTLAMDGPEMPIRFLAATMGRAVCQ